MNKKEDALKQFVNRVKEKYEDSVEEIILFGSYARGEAEEDSDIDILVIWKGRPIDGWNALESIATDILLDYGILISLKIIAPEDYELMLDLGMPFIKNVREEGVVLG
ncbi:MAG: nucleotidyltransferase domain-containing protein [Candidatus Hydrothermarchaeales archaeon]